MSTLTDRIRGIVGGGARLPLDVPDATERVIPKQNHGIKPAALRPVLVEIFHQATASERPNELTKTA